MKRIIAWLSIVAVLISLVGYPASAATVPAEARALPETEILALPAGADRVDPADSASLDEALNVPGGTIEFVSYNQLAAGIYAWVVEADYAKSGNTGIDGDPNVLGNTQAQVYANVYFDRDQAISFDFKVSCQNEERTDYLGFYVDYQRAELWYGEYDWSNCTYPISEGWHKLIWVYNKDASVSEGEDTAYLDNVEVVPFQPYELTHSEELDNVLNVPGGELEFYTVAEQMNGYYPWVAEEEYAKSTNQGVDSTPLASVSIIAATVNANEGDILRFRYKVGCESNHDFYRFYLDGETVESWSGSLDWAVYFSELEPGEHELRWEYEKDIIAAEFEDTAYLDDVYVGQPEAATGVEIQEAASVPGFRQTQLVWNVLPDTAYNRGVSFASSDESIATVDENGIVTGVTQGQAVITVTTNDGSFTDTCLVTVTVDEPPVKIYGFMHTALTGIPAQYWMPLRWCSFYDTNPENVSYIDFMPPTAKSSIPLVQCATLVDGTVYGYTFDGYFFSMDFEAMQRGELPAEYKAVNITGNMAILPQEIAYDYSTGTMYVIATFDQLYEVDMATGNLVLDSICYIDGEIPDQISDDALMAAYGFAIDLEGNAYIMLAGFGTAWGGNGCARFASLDLNTGEYTVIGQTTAKAYQEQSLCFDYNSGKLYWAQFCTAFSRDSGRLFIVDPETAELEECGLVAEAGAGITGMFIPICDHCGDLKTVAAQAPTCTTSGNIAYWQCRDCGKCFCDEEKTGEIAPEDITLPATGHQAEVKNVKEATCTEEGYTGDEVCTICGEILKKGEVIEPSGHGETELRNAKEPTCTEEGYTGDTCCLDCGQLLSKGEVIPAHCASKSFTDLYVNQWYHPYTDYVIDNGLMNGVDSNKFNPNGTTTRAMLVTTLYRMAGEPEVAEKSTFTDVPEDQWFAKAVAWAQDLGIATGVTDTTFCSEMAVTREQTAAFLYRYVTLYLKAEPVKGADLTTYKDADRISNYAKEAVAWATAEGIFGGFPDGTLQPKGTLIRAQLAKVLTVLDQKF